MRFFWSRVECEAAVGSNVRSVPSVLYSHYIYSIHHITIYCYAAIK